MFSLSEYNENEKKEERIYDSSTELPEDYEYEVLSKKIRCRSKTHQNRVCKLKAIDIRGMCHIHLATTHSHGRTDIYVPYEQLGYYSTRMQPTYHYTVNIQSGLDQLFVNHRYLNELTTDIIHMLSKEIPTLVSTKDKLEKIIEFIRNIPKNIPYLMEVQQDMITLYTNFKPKEYTELRIRYLHFIKFYYFYQEFYRLTKYIILPGGNAEGLHTNTYKMTQALYTIRDRIEHKLVMCRKMEKLLDLPKDIIYYCIYPYLDGYK